MVASARLPEGKRTHDRRQDTPTVFQTGAPPAGGFMVDARRAMPRQAPHVPSSGDILRGSSLHRPRSPARASFPPAAGRAAATTAVRNGPTTRRHPRVDEDDFQLVISRCHAVLSGLLAMGAPLRFAGRSRRTLSVAASTVCRTTMSLQDAPTLPVACTARRLVTRLGTARGPAEIPHLAGAVVVMFPANAGTSMQRWPGIICVSGVRRPRLPPRLRHQAPLEVPTPVPATSAQPLRIVATVAPRFIAQTPSLPLLQ